MEIPRSSGFVGEGGELSQSKLKTGVGPLLGLKVGF